MIVEALLAGTALSTPPPDADFWYGPAIRDSEVTVDSALQVTAVLACVRVLAETIAQLPLHLKKETGGRVRENAVDQGLYEVLHDQPNGWQTSFEFREMMQGHLCLRGNAYAQIRPGPRGAVDQLVPLHPDRMEVFRLLADGETMPEAGRIGYLYRDRAGKPYRLTQDEVFHLRFLSLDDCVGMSVITWGKYSVELAQKGDQHGIKFYRNAARPSGVLKMGPNFRFKDKEHLRALQRSWREAHSGDDLFSVAMLEGGAEWQQLGLSNEDAQWLEGRRFQINDIARLFRVPPHLIGSAIEHGHTYANVEQSGLAFVTHTMLPWISRWEQAISRDLIVQPQTTEGERLYPKFNVDGLLRADATTRAGFYEKMLRERVYTRNEVRALEDMNPVEGGDEFDEPKAASPAPFGQDSELALKLAEVLKAGIDKQSAHADIWADKMQAVADLKEQYALEAASLKLREAELAVRAGQLQDERERHGEELKRCDADLTDRHAKVAEDREKLARQRENQEERESELAEREARNAEERQDLENEQAKIERWQQEAELVKRQVLHGWIADAAERIAATEIGALEKRADKAAEDRSKFNTWAVRNWETKVNDYAARTLSPVFQAAQTQIDTAAWVAHLCDSTIKQLASEDPPGVLEQWKTDRAVQLGTRLTEDLCHEVT